MTSPSPPECQSCGACCRDAADGRVPITAQDLLRWRRDGHPDLARAAVPGHFGELGFPADEHGACVHLQGRGGRYACSIYAVRAASCRALEPGSAQCRSYRRAAGLDGRASAG